MYMFHVYDVYSVKKHNVIYYAQFAIQDSGLFGPNPWKFLAQIVYVFPWSATQPLEQILDSEFLLCELGVEVSI